MIPTEIVKLALKGGWKGSFDVKGFEPAARLFGLATAQRMQDAYIALDRTFWEALGKSLGWYENWNHLTPHGYKWRDVAAEFYQLILTEADTTAFWKEILVVNTKGDE